MVVETGPSSDIARLHVQSVRGTAVGCAQQKIVMWSLWALDWVGLYWKMRLVIHRISAIDRPLLQLFH